MAQGLPEFGANCNVLFFLAKKHTGGYFIAMNALLLRLLIGTFLLAVTPAVIGAPFVPPVEKNPPFRKDRLPIDSGVMASLSRQLTLLTQGDTLKTAEERRSAAQALALALALDPSNNGARDNLSVLADGKNPEGVKEDSLNAAKERIWQVLAWISKPEAGSDGNILAALIGEPISVLDKNRPDSASAVVINNKGVWDGWVAPLSAFEEKKVANHNPSPEIEPEKPSEKPDPKAVVVLEKAELKTVLHTYDSQSNKWDFGVTTVKMEASRNSPAEESAPEGEFQEARRKGLRIKVPYASSSDYWRIERAIVNPVKEALVEIHGSMPAEGQIKLTPDGGNYSVRKNHSYLSGPAFILANAALSGVETQGTVLAELDEKNRMTVPPYFWKLLDEISKENGGRLIVPAAAAEYFENFLVLEKPEFFLKNQVLMASTNEDFIALCAKEPTKEQAAVFAKFAEIAAKAEGNPLGPYLTNRFVRQRLEEIVAEAPYHLSAKMLVMQASTIRPRFLSRKVLAAEIWQIVDPINELTGLEVENANTIRLENIYETIRESLGELERYADVRDRELITGGKELASDIRGLTRIIRGRGELWEKYEDIEAARKEMISTNNDLREKLALASGDPLPEDLDGLRRERRRDR